MGSVFEVSFGKAKIQGNCSPYYKEYGAEEDRVIRQESYVKDFKPLKIGVISLQKKGNLKIKGIKNGRELMDFRLMLFRRLLTSFSFTKSMTI